MLGLVVALITSFIVTALCLLLGDKVLTHNNSGSRIRFPQQPAGTNHVYGERGAGDWNPVSWRAVRTGRGSHMMRARGFDPAAEGRSLTRMEIR